MRAIVFSIAAILPAICAEWGSFRGPAAAGVADGQHLPVSWDAARGAGIKWTAAIPGLAHSSPVVWGDRVFVTTAISSKPGATFKPGLYGEGTASEDLSVHRWQVISLDRTTGRILWAQTAYEGVPKEKRHIKSTYASSTPATNGRVVVAWFGSQGVYAYNFLGQLLWKKDLGRIDAGAYDAPDYEWGAASSPVIDGDAVFFQCDQQKGSFLLALDVNTGKTLWRTERDEIPSWASPTIVTAGGRRQIVTNAPNRIRGYDLKSGTELWRLGGSSKITAPTPIYGNGLIFVASGRRPEAPVFAIRPGALGDITLSGGQTSNASVAWSKQQRGSYMPTPILYQGLLYVLGNAGIFDCYDAESGAEVYRERIEHQGSGFSASPVASDGKLYLSSEDGDIYVVRAGRQYQPAGRNPMGEPLMATPALAGGMMLVRGERRLFAIGR